MSQFGNYQANPAYSNDYAPPTGARSVTQQQQLPPAPSGFANVQPGYYAPPQYYVNPGARAPMLDESGNPCCCCGLLMAARAMVLVNLIYYCYCVVNYGLLFEYSRELPDVISKEWRDQLYFKECSRHGWEREGVSKLYYYLYFATFISMTVVLSAVTPILFGTVVYSCGCNSGVDQQIRCSSFYMRYQFCCPEAIVLTLYNLAAITKFEGCSENTGLWMALFVNLIPPGIIHIYSGLVGKAYRNALQRHSNLVMYAPAVETPMQTPTAGAGNVVRTGDGEGDVVEGP